MNEYLLHFYVSNFKRISLHDFLILQNINFYNLFLLVTFSSKIKERNFISKFENTILF